jgi:uncharacterized protein YecE (DUF72 family)
MAESRSSLNSDPDEVPTPGGAPPGPRGASANSGILDSFAAPCQHGTKRLGLQLRQLAKKTAFPGSKLFMTIYVGTSGYAYPEWKGPFYPKTLPQKQWLRYYGEQLPTVEINGTFKRLPQIPAVQKWILEVPAPFCFVLKAPQQITHIRRLKDTEDLVAHFCDLADALAEHRGPLFFQLPPTAKKDLARLRTFLGSLPPRHRAAFEFRHPSWFEAEVFDLLRDHQAALCIADADDELRVPFEATAPWGYLRLRRTNYTDAELRKWIKRVKAQTWKDAFIYFKHEDKANGPRLAKRFLELAD